MKNDFGPRSPDDFLKDSAENMSNAELVTNDMWESCRAINEAFLWVTCLYMEHLNSPKMNNAL